MGGASDSDIQTQTGKITVLEIFVEDMHLIQSPQPKNKDIQVPLWVIKGHGDPN